MSEVTVYEAPLAPTIWLPPSPSWMLTLVALTGSVLLCLIFGAMVCCRRYWADQPIQSTRTTQAGISSAYSNAQRHPLTTTLPWSRYPREGVELATFVTRRAEPASPVVTHRTEVWRSHQLLGRECFLVLD